MGGWGHVKFYPYEKGKRIFFIHAEGGHKKFWGRFYMVACSHGSLRGAQEVSTLEKGGH